MAAVEFTVRFLQSLKATGASYDLYDKKVTGFGFRVTPNGKKTFFIRYRNEHRQLRKYVLGSMDELCLAEARVLARQALAEVNRGIDPQAKLKQERMGETFGDICHLFIEHSRANNRPSTAKEDERYIRKELLDTLGKLKIKEIRRRDVILLLEKVKNRKKGKKIGCPVAANRLQQVISRIFEFAVNRDIVDSNPVYRLKKLTRERPRNRILTEIELRRLLIELQKDNDKIVSLALRLIIMLARRKTEVLAWRWDEIERGVWTLPAHRSKNKRSIPIPLPPQAINLLSEIRALPFADPTGYVFPSLTKPGTHFGDPKKTFRRIKDRLEFENFTIHDLRRTAATRMRTLGVLREDVETVLGHAEGRLIETYQCEFPIDRMRMTLVTWANYLDALVLKDEESLLYSNVIPLRAMVG